VRNLLDNRRFEDKGIELAPERLDLTALIFSLVKNYTVLAEKKKTKILFDAPPQLLLATDKMCLTRIMDNLLSNALKFSPPEINIYVTLREHEKTIDIMVRDEGPGIPVEDQKKLFLKYQRLTPRPTGGESSTGLGLFLVSVMTHKLGGEVICESAENKGSLFTIRLPKATQYSAH